METQQVKNFSVAREEVKFPVSELVFLTTEKKKKSMLGLSHAEKINQIHKRQRTFINNIKTIFGLTKKKKFVDKERIKGIDKVINRYRNENKQLFIEISKFRVACALDNQPEIVDLEEFTKFIKQEPTGNYQDDLNRMNAIEMLYFDMMEFVLLQDSEFFSRFTGQAYKQSTVDSFIPFITPILEHHGYRLNKIKK